MGSPFASLTPEIPSVIVDRVHATLLAEGDADYLTFFADSGGTAGGNIRILLRADPEYETSDPLPGHFIWGLSQGRALLVGGGDFGFGVGWRMVYESPPRFRASGEADAGSLVWKMRRAIWKNLPLNDAVGQDPKADHITDFRAVVFEGLQVTDSLCVDLIEGSITYAREIDKDSI